MEYVIIATIILVTVAVGLIVYLSSKRKTSSNHITGIEKSYGKSNKQLTPVDIDNNLHEFTIQLEMLPAETFQNKNELVEIKDSYILARVNNLIPGLVQVGNVTNNAIQAVQRNKEVLYRAILPAGEKLYKSKSMLGAVRGFYRGADGIKGHANLIPVEAQEGTAIVGNAVGTAMGVAALVVGQYYMSQINSELEKISDGITKIADFQDNEYRSSVFSLVAHVKKIADFQGEILENNELRLSKISQLNRLEEKCTQLLGQANVSLVGNAGKNDLDYSSYEKVIQKTQQWFTYQKALLEILYKMTDLKYTLHFGAVSREYCVALLPAYTNQVTETRERLSGWHQETMKRLGIEISETRRKRDGLDSVVHFVPSLINEDYKYRKMEESTARLIQAQTQGIYDVYGLDTTNFYEEDVQLVFGEGKVYYLPSGN